VIGGGRVGRGEHERRKGEGCVVGGSEREEEKGRKLGEIEGGEWRVESGKWKVEGRWGCEAE
jgi:hypothetical protein